MRIEELEALEAKDEQIRRLTAELEVLREAYRRDLVAANEATRAAEGRKYDYLIKAVLAVVIPLAVVFVASLVLGWGRDLGEQHKPVDCWTVKRDEHLGSRFRVGRVGRERLWMEDVARRDLPSELSDAASPDVAAMLLVAKYHVKLCPDHKFERTPRCERGRFNTLECDYIDAVQFGATTPAPQAPHCDDPRMGCKLDIVPGSPSDRSGWDRPLTIGGGAIVVPDLAGSR